ncbi:TetR/AcrR family transcriptional regulator [Nocardia sp. NBC_00416]|uniref:TetR/AcrR family transcriptional regulator n=1 Tax=Nocardia sp. NBC_00416 TaxID=2975991 RepID=UPI002E1A1722
MSFPVPRQLRADAARNRQLLLGAAAQAFAELGPEVTVAEIARRAGIGKGTVFRHFATKEQLLGAIAAHLYQALSGVGETLLAAEDPTAALLEFMTSIAEMHVTNRAFAQISGCAFLHHPDPDAAAAQAALAHVADELVARARRVGGIREDIAGIDVLLLSAGASHAAEPLRAMDSELWRRYLATIFDGLRPMGAHPLPRPAPHTATWPASCRTETTSAAEG